LRTAGGSPSSAKPGLPQGDAAQDQPDGSALVKDRRAEACHARQRVGEVGLGPRREPLARSRVHDRGRESRGVVARQRREIVHLAELPVDAHVSRPIGLQVQVGAALLSAES
jgi:hypothetical protein